MHQCKLDAIYLHHFNPLPFEQVMRIAMPFISIPPFDIGKANQPKKTLESER